MRRLTAAIVLGFLLATCTSCQTSDLDLNGDGQVTTQELWTAVFNSVCGNQTQEESADDQSDDVSPDDQTPPDETPSTETPAESTDTTGITTAAS